MRAILTLACLAITALAAPHQKRDVIVVVETETDIVWVTEVATVTATPVKPSPTPIFNQHDTAPSPQTYAPPPPIYMSSPTSTTRTLLPTTTAVVSSVAPVVYTTVTIPPAATPTTSSTSTTSTSPVIIASPPVATTSSVIAPPVVTSTSSVVVPTTPVLVNTPPVVTTVQPATTTTAAIIKPTDYSQLVVAHHNLHRRNHSAPDIAWDNNLASAAATIAASCQYGHNTDVDKDQIGAYGQNIAAGVGADNISLIITQLFYNGEINWFNGLYGQANPDMTNFEHWGHFSQIVWRDTSKVGCATQQCNTLAGVASNVPPYFTVCNYQTPGNVGGEYGSEVGASLNLPTVYWNYFS